jgi:hypothetical protein
MDIPKKAQLKRRNTPMVGLFSSRRKPNSKAQMIIPNKDEGLLIIGESEECEDDEESGIIGEEDEDAYETSEEEEKEDFKIKSIESGNIL